MAIRATPTVPDTVVSGERHGQRLGAAIWSQFVVRVASSAGILVVGGYFVDLQSRRVPITSLLVGLISALVYLSELLFAPLAGALSDRVGRRIFLVAGPILGAIAMILTPGGSLGAVIPSLALILLVVAVSRVIQGLGSAAVVPAILGILADGTDGHPLRRGRQMSFYELASSGGIALGAALGPLLWGRLGVASFAALALLYVVAAGLALWVREPVQQKRAPAGAFYLRRAGAILRHPDLALFIPAWIAVNAILGVWITAQLVFVLTSPHIIAGQRFAGSLFHQDALLSAILGGYVLWLSLCIVIWAFVLGRLPRLPTLLVTISGSIIACAALIAMNHGASPAVFIPVVALGVFFEAGFTPAALAYLADVSQAFSADRGLLMGLYSVILGAGYLLGTALGAVAAQADSFDGLAYLTILLAAVAMLSLGVLCKTRTSSQ